MVTLFVALAVASPRLFQVYQKTGIPAIDARVANQFKRYYGKILAPDRQASAAPAPQPVLLPGRAPAQRQPVAHGPALRLQLE